MPTDQQDLASRLRQLLARRLADPSLRVTQLRRLPGGASRSTWSFRADGEGTPGRNLILRMDSPGSAAAEVMGRETALMVAASAAGVPSPQVIAGSTDRTDLGAAYIVMDLIEGETIPRKILRDATYAAARPLLARQCGRILARLHTITPDAIPGLEAGDELASWREALDGFGQPHPAFELAIRWLEQHRPPAAGPRVVHGDFRNGNFIVGPEGIRAVLDWELAHLGDPLEDLGWLCVRAWRFGAEPEVGGFGSVDELVAAYEAESGRVVSRDALHWWQILGTLKWGIICIKQAERHRSGATRSVELATIGRRVAENEWDLLQLLP